MELPDGLTGNSAKWELSDAPYTGVNHSTERAPFKAIEVEFEKFSFQSMTTGVERAEFHHHSTLQMKENQGYE
ncbi:hypothetical protein D3C71_2180840 [compost metagenome]